MSVQGDYNNILRCTFVLYQSLEAAINEKQPILCSSLITSSICTNPFGALDHTYPELSVARATLVIYLSESKSKHLLNDLKKFFCRRLLESYFSEYSGK